MMLCILLTRHYIIEERYSRAREFGCLRNKFFGRVDTCGLRTGDNRQQLNTPIDNKILTERETAEILNLVRIEKL
jgi:hypothetical protein